MLTTIEQRGLEILEEVEEELSMYYLIKYILLNVNI